MIPTPKLLFLFTRTPLHVGAGSSVGAIDQPVARERATGFPIIPASALKGSFADQWPTGLKGDKKEPVRVTAIKDGEGKLLLKDGKAVVDGVSETAWLFGSDQAGEGLAAAGSLLFGEARLLAFPIRSAKGSYAWITSPLLLRRAVRDRVLKETDIPAFPTDQAADGKALFTRNGPLALEVTEDNREVKKIVLEEYAFCDSGGDETKLGALGGILQALIDDPVWKEVAGRLVILSDGQMSYFATTACEVAQHVCIDDETGTARKGGLFNQENVPSETLFYATVRATDSRLKGAAYQAKSIAFQPAGPRGQPPPAPTTKEVRDLSEADAMSAFEAKVAATTVFQFGGDASTGLGYCTVRFDKIQGA